MLPLTCTKASIPCLFILTNAPLHLGFFYPTPPPNTSIKSWPTFVETFVEQAVASNLLVPYPWVSLQESCPVLSSLTVASEPNQCFLRDFCTDWKLVDCSWIFRAFLTLLAWLVVSGKTCLSSLKWKLYSWIMCISNTISCFWSATSGLCFGLVIKYNSVPCSVQNQS